MSSLDEKRGATPGQPGTPSPASPTADRGLILALDKAGRPKLSVTILLARRPGAGEGSIAPLVVQATLAFTARLDTSRFARTADFRLCDEHAELQRVQAIGEGPVAAFSLTLDRDRAVRLLGVLRGEESGLRLQCGIECREEQPVQPLTVRARLADVIAALGDAEALDRAGIAAVVAVMQRHGQLSVSPPGVTGEGLIDAFTAMARPLLRPVTTAQGRRWRVLPVVPSPMILSGRIERTATVARTFDYAATLETLCAPIVDLDRHVRIIAPDGEGDFGPVPPLRPQRQVRASNLVKLGRASGGGIAQLQVLAQPAPRAASAHLMIAAATAHTVATIRPDFITIADLHVAGENRPSREESLPQVDDRAAPLWRDRINPDRLWYAPDYVLVRPAPADDPDAAAFGMTVHAEGHRADGKPGLAGTVRFRLLRRMSVATMAAWEAAGQPAAQPVRTDNLSVQLLIPFRDESGTTRSQAFPAVIDDAGDTIAVAVELIDDWVRLAYGSIAYAGFQTQEPQVSVAYSLRGYVPIDEGNLQLLFDRKQARVDLRRGRAFRGVGDAFLDTETLSWRDGTSTLKLDRESAAARMRGGGRIAATAQATLTIKPNLLATATLAELIGTRKYGVQSIARAQAVPAIFPCSDFGAFYREETADGIVAIGCQDAFRVGQTVYRQYERIDALSDGDVGVWRSLQQPGRFLVAPSRWSIARFDGDEPGERAWRPAIFLYSSVDPDDAAKNRCALLASVVPDIDPARLFGLRRSLRDLAADPQLLSLNDIDAVVSFRWTVPALDGLTVNAVRLHDCIQITAECPLATMPMVLKVIETAGLTGAVSFDLPDGTAFHSDLRLDLARIVGPAPDGPVEIKRDENRLTLTNPIEGALDLSEILTDAATIPIDRRLQPGESIDIEVVSAETALAVRCAPQEGATTLAEIRSFIEDVYTNVAFVNLVNYPVHALAAMSLEARIRDVVGSQQLLLDEAQPVASLEFVLPLTRYLFKPVLEYAVTKAFSDGTTATTDWLEWSLADDGNVVSLTWERIA